MPALPPGKKSLRKNISRLNIFVDPDVCRSLIENVNMWHKLHNLFQINNGILHFNIQKNFFVFSISLFNNLLSCLYRMIMFWYHDTCNFAFGIRYDSCSTSARINFVFTSYSDFRWILFFFVLLLSKWIFTLLSWIWNIANMFLNFGHHAWCTAFHQHIIGNCVPYCWSGIQSDDL